VNVEFCVVRAGEHVGACHRVLGVPADAKAEVNVVAWNIKTGVMSPGELGEVEEAVRREVLPKLDTTKPVVLSGRGPLWLYAQLAHHVHFLPAVAVWDPRLARGVIVSGPADYVGRALGLDAYVSEAKLPFEAKGEVSARLVESPDVQLLHVEVVGDKFAEPRVLERLEREELKVKGDKPVILEGAMPVWLATYYALKLVHKAKALLVYDPRLVGAVVVATHSPEYKVGDVVEADVEQLLRKKETAVIGVVGHPNSGKSVFLHLLSAELRRKGYTTITQEGDLTAPTQEWSLHAPEVRKELKKEMSPEERLNWVVESLERARSSGAVDFVLVDVGGGKPGEGLVTRENAAILSRVDAVVVVSREGWLDWLREMKLYTPNVKVVAVLESKLSGTAEYDDTARAGVVVGLDRELYRSGLIPHSTLTVASSVADAVASKRYLSLDESIASYTAYRARRKAREEEQNLAPA